VARIAAPAVPERSRNCRIRTAIVEKTTPINAARRSLVADPGGSMTDNDDRMTSFERRLDAVGEDVRVLKDDVRGLKDDVRGLKDDVQGLKDDVRVLKTDVHQIRVLYEHHDTQIQTIAEVQAHHGRLLEEHGTLLREIKQELAPLGDLRDFVRRIADNHERRLSALEKHTGVQ
jgi:archaellum component FlaC